MHTLTKTLLTFTAVFTLAPTAALALPLPCGQVCLEERLCGDTCSIGSRITDCEEYLHGVCVSSITVPGEALASLTSE